MSIPAVKWAIELDDVKYREKAVLLVLAWHLNSRTGLCNPSTRTIASEAGMSRNTVNLALAELERTGLIDIIPARRRDASQRYVLNMDPALEGAKTPPSRGSTVKPRRGSTVEPRRGSGGEPRRGSNSPHPVAQLLNQKGNRKGGHTPHCDEDDEIIIPLHGRAG